MMLEVLACAIRWKKYIEINKSKIKNKIYLKMVLLLLPYVMILNLEIKLLEWISEFLNVLNINF